MKINNLLVTLQGYKVWLYLITGINDFHKIYFKALIFHKNIAFFQRKAYNIQRTDNDFLNQILLIEIDLKQKIVIPMSPRQVNAEFYKLQQRSCLS